LTANFTDLQHNLRAYIKPLKRHEKLQRTGLHKPLFGAYYALLTQNNPQPVVFE
jgi:hypothetical protein